jgi:phosphate butyryltransferase
MVITKLAQLLEKAAHQPKKHLVAACATDAHTLEAVMAAIDKGIVDATVVGDAKAIRATCAAHGMDANRFEILDEPDMGKAMTLAVDKVRSSPGQILMKGLVSTDVFMRAILQKEKGLMDPGALLSHVTIIESPKLDRLLLVTDVAVLPQPELKEMLAMTRYVINVAHSLGIEKPRVALVCASEQVNPKIPSMVQASVISKMGDRGQIKGAFIDGPMGLDVALDQESATIKGVGGEVAGKADALIFPNLDAGNAFYKTCTKLADCEVAAMVVGTRSPCVLASRGDSSLVKLYSIALAALNT